MWMRSLCGSVLLALAALLPLHAFKDHDFKKCKDSGFCNRLRGIQAANYTVVDGSGRVQDGLFTFQLTEDTGYKLQLYITAFDGIISITGAEVDAKHRFTVPDVLQPHVGSRSSIQAVELGSKGNQYILKVATHKVVIDHAPFLLTLISNNKPQATINSRGLFHIEHLRTKQEGDPADWWEETFKSHKDTKPKGPQAISLDLDLPSYKYVFGLPEHATSFALQPTMGTNPDKFLHHCTSRASQAQSDEGDGIDSEPYRLYNLDVFEYVHESPFGLYGSIPYVVAHSTERTIGALWLNAAEMYVDVSVAASGGTELQWLAESGMLALYLLLGPTPSDVSRQYTWLTGGTALPQMFSIGYHQCRWNYKDEEDTRSVDAGFDEHGIPYDVIWLDIEHTDGKRYMTWDKQYFPNPEQLQLDIASHGRKTVTIIDPHMKRDDNYYMFKEATEQGLFVKTHDGQDFDGWCWPGSSSYLDVVSAKVRAWWADNFALSRYQGSTKYLYVWNDMNEPSVFNGPEITMHKDCKHVEGSVEHRDVHNAYGLYYHMATADGLKRRGVSVWGQDGDRPFVLSRAFFTGTQTVGPIWTGDNTADWNHLAVSIPMLLSIGITGLTNSGADVGGFFGNPDAELLIRWYQLGTFYPFFRGHAHLETKRREPWLFGDEATDLIRIAIRERYALLPYIYTLFRHANVSGVPVFRPIWYEFPTQEPLFVTDDAFMLGRAILAAPVLESGATNRTIPVPGEAVWYDGASGARVPNTPFSKPQALTVDVDMTTVPTLLRGGSILFRKERVRRSTAAMQHDPIHIVIILDDKANAVGDLYIDDGKSYAFQRGEFMHKVFKVDNGVLTTADAEAIGNAEYNPQVMVEQITVLGLKGGPKGWRALLVAGAGEKALQAKPGPCSTRGSTSDHCLVVRKPGLAINGDWKVKFSR